jgi:hypothetical protein
LLQVVGLVLLPASMGMQFTGTLAVRDMLAMMLFGVAAFWLGRILDGYCRRS